MDTRGVAFKTALALPTAAVVANFQRQYDFYKAAFDEEAAAGGKAGKLPVRTITVFNRLALVLDDDLGRQLPGGGDGGDDDAAAVFGRYQSGGLLNQVRPPVVKSYRSLRDTLDATPVPQMLRGEDWEAGRGVDVHLALAAVLDFREDAGRWPRLHDAEDAAAVVARAEGLSAARRETEGACWSQTIQYGFPTGEPRAVDAATVARYSRLFATELTGFCAFLGGAGASSRT